MGSTITPEQIRRLQKDGEYHFEGLTRSESRAAATALAKAATEKDRRNGVQSKFGIALDSFGYYFAAVITN